MQPRAWTLAEALQYGRGTERPMLCPVHGDTRPSASVNVNKKVWVCYTCGAHGKLTGDALLMEPDYYVLARELEDSLQAKIYPESWLNQFDAGPVHPYWLERFDEHTARAFRLGFDRGRDSVTYPFRDESGRVLGVVRRPLVSGDGPKYLYPRGVDVGSHLFGYRQSARKAVVLVEGALDAVALWRIGIDAWALYGSRLSEAQYQLIERVDPVYIFTAFDNDDAGYGAGRAVERAYPHRGVARLTWPRSWGKDVDEIGRDHVRTVFAELLNRGLSCVECETCESPATSGTSGRVSSTPTSPRGRMRIVPRTT